MQVQAESFHLNGHIIRFRPQTQKLESPYKTPSSTPAVKGLMAIYLNKSVTELKSVSKNRVKTCNATLA